MMPYVIIFPVIMNIYFDIDHTNITVIRQKFKDIRRKAHLHE